MRDSARARGVSRRYFLIVGACTLAVMAVALWNLKRVTRGHEELIVPPPDQFDRLLQRDLDAYFHVADNHAPSVRWTLLRDTPMRSGLSLPKYYLWIETIQDQRPLNGAVKVAAIDRTKFEVALFVPAADILKHPFALRRDFPGALRANVVARARRAAGAGS